MSQFRFLSKFVGNLNKSINPKVVPKTISYQSIKPISPFSTVAENKIHITFIDQEGNRVSVPGRVGQTLLEVAKLNQVDIEGSCAGGGGPTEVRRTEDWVEITYGEGPSCFNCHVQIPSKYNNILPEQTSREIEGLIEVWEEEYTTTSRLACMITLDKRHDGMVVLVPDAPPTDIA